MPERSPWKHDRPLFIGIGGGSWSRPGSLTAISGLRVFDRFI
jgi:hypothetical protein